MKKNVVHYEGMSANEFKEKNPKIVKRVFDEGLSIMDYELSTNQIHVGITAYLTTKLNPQTVENSLPYNFEKLENANS